MIILFACEVIFEKSMKSIKLQSGTTAQKELDFRYFLQHQMRWRIVIA